jgi:capsular exopolysaccharide synthesis family protein
MSAHDIYEVTGNTQQLLEKLVEVDARYNDIQAEYNITRNSLDFLDSKLSEADKALSSRIAQNVSVELGSIMDEIRSNENDYIRLVNEKGIDAQEVKAKKQQLDVVKARYEQLNRSKIAGQIGYAGRAQKYSFDRVSEKLRIERKMNELNFSSREYNRLKQYYETQLKRLPAKQQEYVKLQRDRDAVSKTYVFLKEKLDETRILLGSEVGSVSVVGAAFQPLEPESPDLKKTLLLGLLLGGLCATVYAYSAESLDETIKEELFFRDNRLGRVFMVPFAGRKSRGSDQVSAGSKSAAGSLPVLKITEQLTSPFTESIRMIRAHLDHLSTDHSLQSILVSGTAIDEGTSTICANLGMAFALVGRKTLIVDCDLLRASQHTIFDCDREAGLSDYLMSSEATLEKGLLQQTHIDNLYVLGAGSQVANPSELLGSAKMEALLKTLAERFDAILLDCPPLFLSDSIRLTKLVDGILLVARMGYTRRKPLTDLALDEFFRSRILGVAVIDTASSVLKGYSRYDAVV